MVSVRHQLALAVRLKEHGMLGAGYNDTMRCIAGKILSILT